MTAARACLHHAVSRSCNAPRVVWTCDDCGAEFVRAAVAEARVVAEHERPRKQPHTRVLTTEDRDGYAITPTCAYCGRAADYCDGTPAEAGRERPGGGGAPGRLPLLDGVLMSDRPTIYLSNWSSHRTPGAHGPGRKWTIMARPMRYHRGEGFVSVLTPPSDLAEMMVELVADRRARRPVNEILFLAYRSGMEAHMQHNGRLFPSAWVRGEYVPGLRASQWARGPR